ncbi:MAG TPA: murein biosynthesis integral membrane protein MurJ [Ktedonobacteraceae bacterium]
MESKEQQAPLPEQRKSEQQGYFGWQYDNGDQGDRTELEPLPPVALPKLFLPHLERQLRQSSQASESPAQHPKGGQLPNLPQVDYQPVQDMGTSLGYGQGMAHQYFDAPQPSQPIAKLRQDRLQRLREERLYRRVQPIGQEANTLIPYMEKWSRWFSENVVPRITSLLSSPAKNAGNAVLSQFPAQAGLQQESVGAMASSKEDTGTLQRARIGKATLVLTSAFVASRVLGLLRTSLFASVFGTSSTSDAYLQAFLIPDLIFNIIAGGALLSAFIPVFTNYMTSQNDEKTAWHIASSSLNLAIAVMSGFALLAILFAPALVPLYNPGLHDPVELNLIASLTRIMLLQSIALGTGVIVTSVLNAKQDFRLPAIGTVLYNVGLIVGLLPGMALMLTGQHNDQLAIYAATWGVVLGALLQIGIQIPGLRKVGMRYSFTFDWHHPGVLQIGRQMVPRVINAAMLYISIFVDRGLIQLMLLIIGAASIAGFITQYYQAFQLVLLPLGIFGMAVSTAAFPTLAENVALGRMDRVRNTILETLRSILFMSIPSSVGLIVLGFPIIQVLLEHGHYSLQEAQSTAVPLAFFAVGLTGLAAVEILTRAFYALRDSLTPVVVSVSQFGIKIVLSLILINVAIWGAQWGLGALALSTSIAGLLEAVALYWLLHRRLGDLHLRVTGKFIIRVLVTALVMGICLVIVRTILDRILVTTTQPTLQLGGTILATIKLLIELFVGVFVYVRVARFLNLEELTPLKRVLDRLKLSWI